MPDISMCCNNTCPKKTNCYRFRAEPSSWQSYTAFEHSEKDGCSSYWPLQEAQGRRLAA